MSGRLNLSPRAEWSPAARRREDPQEHRCAKCYGPFGKSAIPLPQRTEGEEVMTETRTKRRYAHELYPHPDEYEGTTPEQHRLAGDRTVALIRQRELALIADALHQGMTGDEAWKWAQERAAEESGEWIAERSEVYGVDWNAIKPYPCGPEPDHHDHYGPPSERGWRQVFRAAGKESECPECTEPVEQEGI